MLSLLREDLADRIADSLLENRDDIPNLCPDLSQKVFDSLFTYSNRPISDSVVDRISEKLTFSRVVLNRAVSKSHCSMIYKQNLEKLEISDLDDDGDSEVAVDILGILKMLLNPKSCKDLTEIVIGGNRLKFVNDWIASMSTMLPSLKSLNIRNCKISQKDFEALTICLPNITSLDISNTGIERIKGIGNMKTLESLNVSNLEIGSVDILEVFRLCKLKYLDLSKPQKAWELDFSRNLKCFMECDGVLLNLEFIDFSGNFHSEQMIWDLLETHTTLRYLCFFDLDGINCSPNFQHEYPHIHPLTTNSFRNCMKSMNHFVHPFRSHKLVEILKMMTFHIQRLELNETDELTTIYEQKRAILKTLSLLNLPQRCVAVNIQVTACVLEMCRKFGVSMFTSEEISGIIKTLLSVDKWWKWTSGKINEPSHKLHANSLEILNLFLPAVSTPEDVERILNRNLKIVMRNEYYKEVIPACLQVINQWIPRISDDYFKRICNDYELKEKILEMIIMSSQDSEFHVAVLISILSAMKSRNLEEKTLKNECFDVNTICVLKETVMENFDFSSIQKQVLIGFEKFVRTMKAEVFMEWMDETWFLELIKMSFDKNWSEYGRRTATVSFLVTIWILNTDNEIVEILKQNIVDEFMNIVDKSEDVRGDVRLGMEQILEMAELPDTSAFVGWLASQIYFM
ncbi:hypothetical protein CRE_14986 [Caenorhabditis remanei]|uniref:Uncharacterized protein n=1 Tax=Caenorhabditis remanei TaxID=31234 RepID=E3NF15_CAERE|nr:hypothetical protein CRE_14986 [Caenorhabditis remanei]